MMLTDPRSARFPFRRTARLPVTVGLLLVLLPMLFLSGCDVGEGPPPLPDGALVIQGGWLFDGTGDERVPNPGIVIADSVVHQVGLDRQASLPPNARVVELTGQQTVIPGIFDLHAHYAVDLLGAGRIDDTSVYPTVFLANGVTSTFPAGEVQPEKMRDLRLRIEAGEEPGPRLFNSGPYFGTWRAGWDQEISPDSIRAEVDHWVERGAHGFKAKGISPAHLEALIEAAHAHGRTVTGHLGSGFRGSVNPRDAIHMGIDRVEHFKGGDAMPADRSAYASLEEMTPDTPGFREIGGLFIEHGVHYNATLTAYGYFGERDPEVYEYFWPEMELLTPYAREEVEARLPRNVLDQFERIYWVKRDLLAAFHDMGGGHLITLGTDHPSWGEYVSGFGAHREMHAMVLAGLPPAQVLRIATINGARALGVDDRLGTIEEGKLADLVILRADPLEDLRATREPRWVVRGGELYDPEALLEGVRGRLGPSGPADHDAWIP